MPLAWMPFEFGFPTIYAMRCASYHFELRTPQGRTPRDLRVAIGPALAEPSQRRQIEDRRLPSGSRKTLTPGLARLDVPPSAPRSWPGERPETPQASQRETFGEDLWLRLTVGIADNAFPVLWFLAGLITATMLWLLAAANPEFGEAEAQIASAILLVVPALVAGLAVSSNEVPVTQLVGGARILLLITGLSSVAATAVIAGARPWNISAEWGWAACAMAATAVTVPLGTSWLLANPVIWLRLKRLNTRRRQRAVFGVAVSAALAAVLALIGLCHDAVSRGAIAVFLLSLPVAMSVIANDRAAMKVNDTRNYLAASVILAGMVCLTLGCIELRGVIDETGNLQWCAQWAAFGGLIGSLFFGDALYLATSRLRPKQDEVHVSAQTGREILAGERVRELAILRSREEQAKSEQETADPSEIRPERAKGQPIRHSE